MPIEAKARDVRSHARKVLSNAKWSRATLPLFSSSIAPNLPKTVGAFTFDPLVVLLLSGAAAGVFAARFSREGSDPAIGGKGSSWLLFAGR